MNRPRGCGGGDRGFSGQNQAWKGPASTSIGLFSGTTALGGSAAVCGAGAGAGAGAGVHVLVLLLFRHHHLKLAVLVLCTML